MTHAQTPSVRRIALALVTALLLTLAPAAPASAGWHHGYCGHGTHTNWYPTWRDQTIFIYESYGNHYYRERRKNNRTGQITVSKIHNHYWCHH